VLLVSTYVELFVLQKYSLAFVTLIIMSVGNGMISISSPAMSLVAKKQNGILSQYLFSITGLFYPALQGPNFV